MKHKTKEWKEDSKPFIDATIDLEMFGPDVRIKRFKIYEDDKIKVIRTEEPTFSNEHNNFIELLIKNGAILMYFPIGGYINRQMATENAKQVAELFVLKSIVGSSEDFNKLKQENNILKTSQKIDDLYSKGTKIIKKVGEVQAREIKALKIIFSEKLGSSMKELNFNLKKDERYQSLLKK